jgi:DHA2 family multidrug resistance protein
MQAGLLGYQSHLRALQGVLGGTAGAANSAGMALGSLYNQLNQQALMQGYQDVYIELSWMSVGLVLLAFLLSKNRPGQGPGAQAVH